MFALVQAARLIGSHFTFESSFRQLLLEELLEFRLGIGIAAAAGMSGRALIAADEDVFFKLGHGETVQDFEGDAMHLRG